MLTRLIPFPDDNWFNGVRGTARTPRPTSPWPVGRIVLSPPPAPAMCRSSLGLGVILLALLLAPAVHAQKGDKKGDEAQTLRVPREKIPPAPPLSPADALKTFKLAPGFRLELVASEPLVVMPVALAFAPDGRLWVVEMRGFMPNVDGRGEQEPLGRVAILEDTDGDGRMDKRTTFLDGLVMPRALLLARGGALVAEPPHLWFCRDTDGDGRCDEKIEVASDYGDQRNPEHTANGLVWNLDNWVYNLYHTYRYRFADGKWAREPDINRAQWGLAHDDVGRLFYTANSDQLRGDLLPAHYLMKRGPGARLAGIASRLAAEQSTWPIRVNPGVNRAYQPKQLRADGTLATFTAACGSSIYRGDALPEEVRGNAFICEPSGNFVRRAVLTEKDGVVTAQNAYDKAEFLASTDERFRPVNTGTGPDGALYVVDMYHGIIQHRIFVTSYLRQQIEERHLEQPQNQGRIYRVLHESRKPGVKPDLGKADAAELVRHLSHPNGWWRDTAQQLLVERAEVSVVPALQTLLASGAGAVPRLHALWTLEGLGRLDRATLASALKDAHAKVRAAAVRLSEPALRSPGSQAEAAALRAQVLALAKDPSADVQTQVALTLGAIVPDAASQAALTALTNSSFALTKSSAAFSLAGSEPATPPAPVVAKGPALSPEELKRFDAGKAIYEMTCLACHQPHGLGQAGLAPPLAGSEWVSGSEKRLVLIVLHGVRGPIKVKSETYELDMPSLNVLDDEQIAAALTYVRREWGHQFAPVAPATIKKIREETANREDSWTAAELLRIP